MIKECGIDKEISFKEAWARNPCLLVLVIALAFRLNTYEASRIRQRVLESLCRRKENGISLLFSLNTQLQMNSNINANECK